MRTLFGALFAVLLLGGCNPQAFVESFLEPAEIALAERLYGQLARGDVDGIRELLSSEITDDPTETILSLSEIIPDEAPVDMQSIAAGRMSGAGSAPSYVHLERLYAYENVWIVYTVALMQEDGELRVRSFFVRTMSPEQVAQNDFTLAGQSALHYVILALAVAIPGFVLFALISCLRSPLGWGRKLLWSAFIVVGLMQLRFNWTTGELGLSLLTVQLFGAGFFKAPLQPVLIFLGLPLGAWIWMSRRSVGKPPAGAAAGKSAVLALETEIASSSSEGGGGDGD